MTNPDLVVGMSQAKINEAVGKLFDNSQLKAKVFEGRQEVDFAGLHYSANWKIETAPTLELRVPTNAEWDLGVKEDGTMAVPGENCFLTNLNQFSISLNTGTDQKQITIPVKAICVASHTGQTVPLTAFAVIIDLSGSSPMDQFFAKAILIPNVLKSVNETLSGINLPIPTFAGVTLTPPTAAEIFYDEVKKFLEELFKDATKWAKAAVEVLHWPQEQVENFLASEFHLDKKTVDTVLMAASPLCALTSALNNLVA